MEQFLTSIFLSSYLLLILTGRGGDGAIASMGEPDWSIAKAEVVQELYSYEPNYLPRSLFPLFRAPLPPSSSSVSASNHRLQVVPTPTPPKYTKFSMQDKKDQLQQQPTIQQPPRYLPPPLPLQNLPGTTNSNSNNINNHKQQQHIIGPVYEHPTLLPTPTPTAPTHTSNPTIQTDPQFIDRGGYTNSNQADATSVDKQTIVWPQNMEQGLQMSGDETALRFVVHKAGDEGEIKKALEEDGAERGQEVKFIEGPTLRIQRHQKVYLPPKKKTVVYILLKEPQILTDVEVVGPTEEPVPEVFITYQRSDGGVRTKHYSPEVVKSDKYLRELGSSLVERGNNHVVGTRSVSSKLDSIVSSPQALKQQQPLLCPSDSTSSGKNNIVSKDQQKSSSLPSTH